MIRKCNKTIVVLAALSFLAGLAWGEEFCVSNATQLQDALTEAAANGDEDIIRVVQGTYIGNFTFDSYDGRTITLEGGYSSDCTSRILDPTNTILDGNNAGRVLYISNSGGFQGGICAFTDDEDFGPLFVDEMDVRIRMKKIMRRTLRRLRVRNNDQGEIAITNNIIENNNGGGIVAFTNADVVAGPISIIDNTITGNTGRGVRTGTWGGYTEFYGNTISGNTSLEQGGGVYAASYDEFGGGNIAFINNIITENSSIEGGGIYSRTDGKWTAGGLSLINNTITGNLCSDSGGGVCIECIETSTLNLYNNIIWSNSALAGGDIFMKIDPEYLSWIESKGFNNDYATLSGSWTNSGGNINSDPQFVDAENRNYHLQSISPCIDTGMNNAPRLPVGDYDGDPRIFDGNEDGTATVDMGADEFIGIPLQTLTIMSSSGGSTNPASGEYLYDLGTEVIITAIPDDYYRFNHWSGDVSGTANPITITMSSDVSITANFIRIIYPPSNFTGQKVLNRSLSQAEYINVLNWQADPNNVNIVKYRIYQIEGESRNLLAELSANTFNYWHRRVGKDRQYTYTICAVNDEDREGDPTNIPFFYLFPR